ncbi:hypothetical protein HHI36_008970 [Cryptolaemus montrouzieri]|uniref:Uncharacterized protein n=1 Tax=Cryptolaemus montrouzieri TaxID=559131 RepID=A0ABD2MTX2_9CUCU
MRLLLVFVITCLYFIQTIQTKEILCDTEKGFLCYDDTRFYQCVHTGDTKIGVVTGELQNCPKGLLCNNDKDLECSDEAKLP